MDIIADSIKQPLEYVGIVWIHIYIYIDIDTDIEIDLDIILFR